MASEGLFYGWGMMRIVVADDQAAVRSALMLLLEHDDLFQVVGEADCADSLLRLAVQIEADLLLLDWELPGLACEVVNAVVEEKRPFSHIIAMSSHPEAENAARSAGIHHFLSKSEPPDRVREIISQLRFV